MFWHQAAAGAKGRLSQGFHTIMIMIWMSRPALHPWKLGPGAGTPRDLLPTLNFPAPA